MAKFQPRIGLTLDIEDDNGTVVDTYKVSFKEPSKKELRRAGSGIVEAIDMYSDIVQLNEDIEVVNSNIDAYKRFGDTKAEKKAIEQRDKLRAELKKLADKFEEIGGAEKSEDAERIRLDIAISGEDKDKVMQLADDTGMYADIYNALLDDMRTEQGKRL